MKFLKYLNLSLIEKTEITEHNVQQKDVLDLLIYANKELDKYYSGKYKIGLSNNPQKDELKKLTKISPKKLRTIKEK